MKLTMRLSSTYRPIARWAFLAFLVLCVPATSLSVLYAGPFDVLRRAKVERLLSEAMDLDVAINGPIDISFDLEPKVSIADITALEDELPPDLKAMSAKSLSLKVPLLPLLVGHVQLNSLVVDGLKIAIDIPEGGAAEDEGGVDAGELVGDFVRSHFAGDLLIRDAEFEYVNPDSGFDLRFELDEIKSRPSVDGGVSIDGAGLLNGEPWKLDGDVGPPGDDEYARKFVISVIHTGLKNAAAGTYYLDGSVDTVDMTVTASAPKLKQFLTIYEVSCDLEGSGDLSGRLTGQLDALKLTDFGLRLAFETGDTFQVTGAVGNLADGSGLDLELTGSLVQAPIAEGEEKPIYDIGITGFTGRIEGSLGGVVVRDFHILTSSVTANLHNIGPITAERLYKDPQGRLGLYDVLVLAGDPQRPSVRVAGTVKDILTFQGIDLKGKIDSLTADFLDLAAEEHAEEFGHLRGKVAISDSDGSLGIETLTAKVTDSSLLKLSIDLVFDDVSEADEVKFATHLDIPRFKPFAAALGSEVEKVGTVKFDGTITGSDEKITMAGTTLVGQTTIDSSLTGAFSQGRPVLSGDISTALLHLSDTKKISSINTVYQANVDEKDADALDYSKVWETLFVDLRVKVAKIAGGGNGPSNIEGRVTYLAGVIGLDPLTLTFLGGKASANGTINTKAAESTFALKGRVDNLRIGAMLKELQVSYPVKGALTVTYDLSGAGNTTSQIPQSLSGKLSISLRNGWIGTGLLDLKGMSLPAWLLTRARGGNQADLVCAAAPFTFSKGRGKTYGLVFETTNVQVIGLGFIDFRQDNIDLRFKPQALRRQFIKVAQPFAISGKLSSPTVTLGGSPVAGAATGVFAFPFNLLGTIVLPKAEAPGRVPCRVAQTE